MARSTSTAGPGAEQQVLHGQRPSAQSRTPVLGKGRFTPRNKFWVSPDSSQKSASEIAGQRGCLGLVRFRGATRETAGGSVLSGSDEHVRAPTHPCTLSLGRQLRRSWKLSFRQPWPRHRCGSDRREVQEPFWGLWFHFLNQVQEDYPGSVYQTAPQSPGFTSQPCASPRRPRRPAA